MSTQNQIRNLAHAKPGNTKTTNAPGTDSRAVSTMAAKEAVMGRSRMTAYPQTASMPDDVSESVAEETAEQGTGGEQGEAGKE